MDIARRDRDAACRGHGCKGHMGDGRQPSISNDARIQRRGVSVCRLHVGSTRGAHAGACSSAREGGVMACASVRTELWLEGSRSALEAAALDSLRDSLSALVLTPLTRRERESTESTLYGATCPQGAFQLLESFPGSAHVQTTRSDTPQQESVEGETHLPDSVDRQRPSQLLRIRLRVEIERL